VSDRIFGSVLTVLALALFVSATQLESPFFADPLGPKSFPFIVSGAALVCSLVIIIKPDMDPLWPDIKTLIKLLIALVVLVLYAFSLKNFGFLLPTALASAALSYLIQPSVFKSSATGIILSLSLFIIFKFGLGLSLFPFPKFLIG
jgi:putative tricarboxylic transport membrane protein|tara:strand:+ start:784 stop:1221 length:438 start_codon:yes stop_codon:yes gene_type:complete